MIQIIALQLLGQVLVAGLMGIGLWLSGQRSNIREVGSPDWRQLLVTLEKKSPAGLNPQMPTRWQTIQMPSSAA